MRWLPTLLLAGLLAAPTLSLAQDSSDEDEQSDDPDETEIEIESESESEGESESESEGETETESEGETETETESEEETPRRTAVPPPDAAFLYPGVIDSLRGMSIAFTAAGAGASVGSGITSAVATDQPYGAPLAAGLYTGGVGLLGPGTVGLIGSVAIAEMSPRTGRGGVDLYRWQAGMFRACLGAGWLLAGSAMGFLPVSTDGGATTELLPFQIAGGGYGVIGAVLLADGYHWAQKGLWYPRPTYALAYITAGLLIVPKVIHMGMSFSPAWWDPARGVQDLVWIGVGAALVAVELGVSRGRVGHRAARASLEGPRGAAPPRPSWVAIPWMIAGEDQPQMGVGVVGRW